MFYNSFQVFFMCFFASVSDRFMFQVFHLPSDVYCNYCIWMFQIDRALYVSPHFLLHRLGVSSSQHQQGIAAPSPSFLDASDVRSNADPTWTRENSAGNDYRRGCPDASKPVLL
jgi:hypothetical protein